MRLQKNNYVYILDEKPSWDNVIALIICWRSNRYYCLLAKSRIRATPIQPRAAGALSAQIRELYYISPPNTLGPFSAPLKVQ